LQYENRSCNFSQQTGAVSNTIRWWDTATGRESRSVSLPDKTLPNISFCPDGRRVVTRDGGTSAKVWDATTDVRQADLDLDPDYVGEVAFSPDGRYLATINQDGTTVVYPWEMFASLDDLLVLSREPLAGRSVLKFQLWQRRIAVNCPLWPS
jgi:WD40 repeat protein